MGVDTKGLLRGKVSPEMVLNFIRQTFDPGAKSYVKLNNFGDDSGHEWIRERYDDSGEWKILSGFISFNNGIRDRSLFYYYTNHNAWENLEYYSELGLGDMVRAETTYLSLYKDDIAIDDMRKIVAHFGGWIDEDDSDDESYYPIEKSENGTIQPVIRVTMEDIYKKFGGVVVISK